MRKRSYLGALALVLAAGGPAAAQVSHLCGGLGLDERAEMDATPHNLKIEYAEPGGSYLGGIRTVIRQGGTELIDVQCDGPWLLTTLPAGTYAVTSVFDDRTKESRVNVPATGKTRLVVVF